MTFYHIQMNLLSHKFVAAYLICPGINSLPEEKNNARMLTDRLQVVSLHKSTFKNGGLVSFYYACPDNAVFHFPYFLVAKNF